MENLWWLQDSRQNSINIWSVPVKKKEKDTRSKIRMYFDFRYKHEKPIFSFLRYSLRIFLIQSIGFANWLFDMVRFWSVMVKRKFSSELNKTIFSHNLNLKVTRFWTQRPTKKFHHRFLPSSLIFVSFE